MKRKLRKVIASLLVMVMLLTAAPLSGFTGLHFVDFLSSKAYAREVNVADREIATFGTKSYRSYTKPGEEATIVIEWKAALDEWNKTVDPDMGEEPLEFDKDGTIVIPFYVQPTDVSMSPLQKVELTDAAKAAGATLTDETAEIMGDDSEEMRAMYFVGTVTLPASYLFTTEGIDVLNVTFKISKNWAINGSFIAETPIDIIFNVAEMGMTGMPVTVVSADGTEACVYNATLGGSWCYFLYGEECKDGLVYNDKNQAILLGYHNVEDKVTIPDSVSIIGDCAFSNCTGLTSITIPDSVKKIGDYAFEECQNLTDIYYVGTSEQWDKISKQGARIPNTTIIHFNSKPVTSGQCGDNVFWDFDKYSGTLTISGTGDMYDYTEDAPLFSNNNFIKTVVIEKGVTSIGSFTLYECHNVTKVYVPSTVNRICSSDENIEYFSVAFDLCGEIGTPFEIHIDDIASWCNISMFSPLVLEEELFCNLFIDDTLVTDLVIPEGVTKISNYSFLMNQGIESVIIPDSVEDIGNLSFYGCFNLEKVVIGNGVTNIGIEAFEECINLTDLIIGTNVKSISLGAFLDCESLKNLSLPYGVTNIDDLSFGYCKSLISVTIPNSIKYLDIGAFEGCNNVTDLILIGTKSYWESVFADPDISESPICHIFEENGKCGKNAFYIFDSKTGNLAINGSGNVNDYKIMNYDYPEFTIHQISPFYKNGLIKNVEFESGITSIGKNLFNGCYNLENITVPSSVTEVYNNAFDGCNNLKNIVFVSDDYIKIDDSTFNTCPNVLIHCRENSYMQYYAEKNGLKYCIIDDNNNPSFEIENDVLVKYKGESENVFISSASKIGFEAFAGNTNVKSIELANNVTRIYNSAFKNCSNLEKIIIPKNVSSIGNTAFTGCDNLTIWCYAGSYAEAYAINHDIPVEYIKLNLSDSRIIVADSEEITLDASFNTTMVETDRIIWASSNPEIATVENGIVKILDVGEVEITATTASGLSAACEIKVDLKLDSDADAIIDDEVGLIYGNDLLNKNANRIKDLFINNRVNVTSSDTKAGTGSTVALLKADGTVYKVISVVIFGDVNGDGVYDGTDSIIVNCLANGLLSKEQVGEAKYMAADCNHDGVINQLDVDILEKAGLILASVNQNKSPEELMSDSAYVEYLSLIDQNPIENTDIDDTNSVETTETTSPKESDAPTEVVSKNILQKIFVFIINFISIIKSILVVIK